MQMRHPSSIFRRRSNFREYLAARDLLSNAEPGKASHAEMPIKSKKLLRPAGVVWKRMPQNHNRPIIERLLVVRKRVNQAVYWSANCATRRDLQIDSQMNGAPLVRRFSARAKQRRSVERSRFVIPPDAHASTRTFHFRKGPFA